MSFADMTKVNNIVECVLSSCTNQTYEAVNTSIAAILKHKSCLSENTLFELKVILNELLNNALMHGNRSIQTKKIKLAVGISDTTAIISVEDEGAGFDFKSTYQKEQNSLEESGINDIKENGRGVMIIAGLCDEISFNEKGNRVEVKKLLYGV